MSHIYDTIIIGGGPAGYSAALFCARAGLDCVVIEKLCASGQMGLTGIINNYPGFEEGIDGFTLGIKMQKCAERFGAETIFGEVSNVDFSDKIKSIEVDGDIYLSKTVVIATGAYPRELGIAREQEFINKGVHYCAHCDGTFYKDKTVVVIGGGNSAVEDALYLSRIAKKVYLVHRRDSLRASKIYHTQLMNTENIKIIWNSVVSHVVGNNKVDGIVIKNNKDNTSYIIDCDGLFVSIGRKPYTEFLNNILDLDESGYIIADESTKTNIKGVFAAGDVRTKTLRQIVTAVSDGANASNAIEQYLSFE